MIAEIVKILGVSKNSYWNYKKQGRPIIFLLEKYFTKEELQEFLQTDKIKKLENVDDILMENGLSFFLKLKKLNLNIGKYSLEEWSPGLKVLCDFIVNYILLKESYYNSVWCGTSDIDMFKAYFYEYLIDIKCDSLNIVYMSKYINSLETGDLIYLNISIKNGFTAFAHNKWVAKVVSEGIAYPQFFAAMMNVLDIEMSEHEKRSKREMVNKKISEIIQEKIFDGNFDGTK